MLHGALDELQRGGGCQYVVDQGFKVKRPMRRPQSGPPMLRVEKLDREETPSCSPRRNVVKLFSGLFFYKINQRTSRYGFLLRVLRPVPPGQLLRRISWLSRSLVAGYISSLLFLWWSCSHQVCSWSQYTLRTGPNRRRFHLLNKCYQLIHHSRVRKTLTSLQIRNTILHHHRSQRNAGVHLAFNLVAIAVNAAISKVSNGTGIHASLFLFQFGN